MSPDVVVVGGGLAGCEAAWHVAQAGLRVRLYEMRPVRQTEVHRTGDLAELVCSNSFRGASLEHAPGLLKEEMRRLGSLVMSVADRVAVPAGAALAVDREAFARGVTEAIETHPLVEVCREEVREIPTERPCVVATGPLTSPPLAEALRTFTGERHLSFFDAAAPIVTLESVDMAKVFRASRYGRGDDDAYLNCPLDEGEYRRFWEALVTAEIHQPHDFEADLRFFEGCLPVEEMARRGYDTLRFGPMKPVGLVDPRTGRQPYAVVQLRQDNREGTLFNLVGFQTSLKWGEQRRVFRLIPGLENAEFVRYGVMHRNLFLCSPRLLLPTLQARRDPGLLFAGQMTGVEGYVESAATGIVAGINATRLATGREPLSFPVETAVGALCHYIATANPETFQPMNIAFGLLPPPDRPVHDRRRRRQRQAQRALAALAAFVEQQGLAPAGRRWQGAL